MARTLPSPSSPGGNQQGTCSQERGDLGSASKGSAAPHGRDKAAESLARAAPSLPQTPVTFIAIILSLTEKEIGSRAAIMHFCALLHSPMLGCVAVYLAERFLCHFHSVPCSSEARQPLSCCLAQ